MTLDLQTSWEDKQQIGNLNRLATHNTMQCNITFKEHGLTKVGITKRRVLTQVTAAQQGMNRATE